MSSSNAPIYINQILTQITTSNNIVALAHTFRAGSVRETKEALLSSFLSNDQDPLAVMDLRTYTLGALYILSSSLSANFTHTPAPDRTWSRSFVAHSTLSKRLAPERATKLAKGIQLTAAHSGNFQPSLAIQPLFDLVLVMRYPPTHSHLTTIHPISLLLCVATRNFLPALPVLAHPITDIDTANLSPDLDYTDNLTYDYTGGIAFAALKKRKEYFKIYVTSPGTYPVA